MKSLSPIAVPTFTVLEAANDATPRRYVDQIMAARTPSSSQTNDSGPLAEGLAIPNGVVIMDASGGALQSDLPTGTDRPDGTVCTLVRQDSTANVCTVVAMSGDKFVDGTTSYSLAQRRSVTFVWLTANGSGFTNGGAWYPASSANLVPASPVYVTTTPYAASVNTTIVTLKAGAVTINLPTAPVDGSVISVTRGIPSGGGAGNVTITPGGTDTGSYVLVGNYQTVTLMYVSSVTAWYPVGTSVPMSGIGLPTPSNTSSTIMSRDNNGRCAIQTPSTSTDIANKGYVDGVARPLAGSNLTGAVTLAANTFYTADATSAAFSLTLPTAPTLGSQVTIWRTDSTTNNINVFPGGTDTIADASPWQMYRGAGGVVFTYIGTTWYAAPIIGGTSGLTQRASNSNIAGALVQRDGNARARFNDPAAAQDAATKNYVDGLTIPSITTVSLGGTSVAANQTVNVALGSSGSVVLPTAPADGTFVRFFRTGPTGTTTITPGGTDTIYNGQASYTLVLGSGVVFVYQASTTRWLPISYYSPAAAAAATPTFASIAKFGVD